jgi:hypothetical protein
MEYADKRGSATIGARKSLRAFKQTPHYEALLKELVARRETASMTNVEKRRVRLDRTIAELELKKLRRGETLTEFAGILELYDPMRGLIETGVEE